MAKTFACLHGLSSDEALPHHSSIHTALWHCLWVLFLQHYSSAGAKDLCFLRKRYCNITTVISWKVSILRFWAAMLSHSEFYTTSKVRHQTFMVNPSNGLVSRKLEVWTNSCLFDKYKHWFEALRINQVSLQLLCFLSHVWRSSFPSSVLVMTLISDVREPFFSQP